MRNGRWLLRVAVFVALTGLVAITMRPAMTASLRTVKVSLTSPPQVPPAAKRAPALVAVQLETVERRAVLAEGVEYEFWTFNGTVPGPMIRVREGDTIELRIKNAKASRQIHSIGLHATGSSAQRNVQTTLIPAGGAAIVEFRVDVPGNYLLVDHSIYRIDKGAVGIIEVTGPQAPSIFKAGAVGNDPHR